MNQRVLLVDDEPKVLASLRRCLADRFTLVCAESGAEALALLDSDGPFAAVVSDMRMPGMNGIELLREMRHRVPETVRLVLSGHADFSVVVAAINEGSVFRFHTKPVAPEVLSESLEFALLRHQREKAAGGSVEPSLELVREVAEVRRALAEGEIQLYLQPQCRLEDGAVVGAEALVRWAHPQRGLLLPGQFLAAAEAGDMMGELTAYMLDRAGAQLSRWNRAGLPPYHIAVNATALDFADAEFVRRVRRTLDRHGVDASALEVELTEGVAIADIPGTQAVVRALGLMGVSTSLDDFGSGHASLGWLRQLPVAKLKIDRMFVEDIASEPAAYRMLQNIVALARDLNLTVLAEGVETAEQLELARRAGCHLVQGYLVARPMPAQAFEDWLSSYRPGGMAGGG